MTSLSFFSGTLLFADFEVFYRINLNSFINLFNPYLGIRIYGKSIPKQVEQVHTSPNGCPQSMLFCTVLPYSTVQSTTDDWWSLRSKCSCWRSCQHFVETVVVERLLTECEDLIKRMLTVDASKRSTIHEIISHRWMSLGAEDDMEFEELITESLRPSSPVPVEPLNESILQHMTRLDFDRRHIIQVSHRRRSPKQCLSETPSIFFRLNAIIFVALRCCQHRITRLRFSHKLLELATSKFTTW